MIRQFQISFNTIKITDFIFVKDVAWLAGELGNVQSNEETSDPQYNHVSFVWAKDVRQVINDKVIAIIP